MQESLNNTTGYSYKNVKYCREVRYLTTDISSIRKNWE